ncbi:MAG: hypothetical protein K0V04_19460 [Deltaproteobacteria bacterium]|nr:hypothetical protein [Deltaproteobacteria bacterium]
MHHRASFLALAAALVLPACGKDANTTMCLDEFKQFEAAVAAKDEKARQLAGGIYQSCGISCDITKDEEACAAFKQVTEVLCEKEGKEHCETLCKAGESESNEHACAALANMK